MDLVFYAAVVLCIFGLGYGLRGLVSKELKALDADYKAAIAKVEALEKKIAAKL